MERIEGQKKAFDIGKAASKSVFGLHHHFVVSSIAVLIIIGTLQGLPEKDWESVVTEALRDSAKILKEEIGQNFEPDAAVPLMMVLVRQNGMERAQKQMEEQLAAHIARQAAEAAEQVQVEADRALYIQGKAAARAGEDPAGKSGWWLEGYDEESKIIAEENRLHELAQQRAEEDAKRRAAEEEARLQQELEQLRQEEAGGPAPDPGPQPEQPEAPVADAPAPARRRRSGNGSAE